jgi:hypothetical protein
MALRPIHLRILAWTFLKFLDSGEADDLTIDEVTHQIERGTLPAFLKARFGEDVDFRVMQGPDWVELSDEWQRMANALDYRKLGVEKKGVALLMGFALQGLQDRDQG